MRVSRVTSWRRGRWREMRDGVGTNGRAAGEDAEGPRTRGGTSERMRNIMGE